MQRAIYNAFKSAVQSFLLYLEALERFASGKPCRNRQYGYAHQQQHEIAGIEVERSRKHQGLRRIFLLNGVLARMGWIRADALHKEKHQEIKMFFLENTATLPPPLYLKAFRDGSSGSK